MIDYFLNGIAKRWQNGIEAMNQTEITKARNKRALFAAGLRYEGLTFRQIGEHMGGITVETARQAVLMGERLMAKHYAALNECAEMISKRREPSGTP